jgi:methylenetetrahydrofolate reductase (NADPH)
MIRELFGGKPTFSCEFFPPKTADGEATLWNTIDSLSKYRPDFVSVTYGAGGSNQETSLHVTSTLVNQKQLATIAHLTCVGRTAAELSDIVDLYANAGVRDILALRGDPVTGAGTAWQTTPGGFTYAIELVEMLRNKGEFSIGVAAFPEGHPESHSREQDARVLADKQKAGAHFAMTNLFFNVDDYFRMIDDAAKFGCDMPIVPGLMPLTNVSQIERFTTLSGAAFPASLAEKFRAISDDADAVLALGVEVATELAQKLLHGGAPGIHIYSLNKATSTARIFDNLGVATR